MRRVALLLGLITSLAASESIGDFSRDIRPLLATYCFPCHGNAKSKGGLNLERFGDQAAVQQDFRVWLDVQRHVDEREMPPASEKKQLSLDEWERLSTWLRWASETIDPALKIRDPGRVVLHRLSKVEFNNTYRDLLGIPLGLADDFPDDFGGDSGFDNGASTLFISPLMVEKLMVAATMGLQQAKVDRLFPQLPPNSMPARDRRALAKDAITAFVARAWRRPERPGESSALLKLYDAYQKKGQSWEAAMRQVFRQILLSPQFIFRAEEQRLSTREPYELGAYELANRLSYFFWSSMPDDELFALAKNGTLRDPAVIDQQVTRMLSNPKAAEFGQRFAGQWLGTEQLRRGGGPDASAFPAFTERVRDAMCDEPGVFYNELIRHDRSVLDLIDCDYIIVNGDLAPIYGVRGVSGDTWKQVPRPDAGRGGVLTMPGVLAFTSNPQRTSPVKRGAWVLEHLLNATPPPPPPDVPPLDENPPATAAKAQTLRERLEAHRANVACAGCHSRIDPIGFALEGYDVLGRTRARDEHGEPLDTTGKLNSGETFNDAAGLKRVLMARKDVFARLLVEKLLAYALGRKVERFDRTTVSELTAALQADGWRIKGLLRGIARSYPMRFSCNAGAISSPVSPVSP